VRSGVALRLGGQTRLANPGLARDQHTRPTAAGHAINPLAHGIKLRGTANHHRANSQT